ncbi:MAG: NAD(P)-dependent oxidoreductase [Leptolyngbyaceae cyanobacterium bins.59]|nr:NAD(P)-dependent oxidoreductase [Leptolyngbyaceae cyanobacterium bins.59]
MKKLLVTGASGFLGWNLCEVARSNWEVYGTYLHKPFQMSGVKSIQLDLTNQADLRRVFQEVQPAGVVHLGALSKPNDCQNQPELSYTINVVASREIAGLCADREIPCAFTSTDLVFDGLNAPYRETDPVSPVNLYGEQKVKAEEEMLARYPQTAVCRMPLMFGVAETAPSFLQPFVKMLRDRQELKLFVDEFRTPVGAKTAARGLLLALEKAQGRLHLGGRERISRYEFGQRMVEVLALPREGLQACRQADVQMAAPRPPDVSLDSSRAFTLGYAPPSVREELEQLRGQV